MKENLTNGNKVYEKNCSERSTKDLIGNFFRIPK